MPSLGADMTEGTLLEWLVKPGDVVHRGDVVAVVDTSKSAIDVEVFQDGRVTELLVEPGTTVPVGAPLALVEGADATAEPDVAVSTVVPPAVASSDVTEANASEPTPVASHRGSSPLARRRAAELGIDLAAVQGHGGVISVADVEAYAEGRAAEPAASSTPAVSPEQAPGPESALPLKDQSPPGRAAGDHAAAMRQAIANLMARSKRDIPHYYLQSTIDMARALAWLASANAERAVPDRLLPAALMLKAVAVAAREVPEMNGFFVDGAFAPQDRVHLGVAVSLRGGGLIAPALHDVDTLPLDEVMRQLKDLVTRARTGRLRSSEMSDPTLTVTNLGEQGAEVVHGVIYPPQVALVGIGRIVERPWAVDGMLTVHPLAAVTLAADHRVGDGHRGGIFLAAIDSALQSPQDLQGGDS